MAAKNRATAFSFRSYALWILFISAFLILLIVSPLFRNPQNLLNLLQQNAVYGQKTAVCEPSVGVPLFGPGIAEI